ncbi:MAG: ABC transporter substrate-binding protein [Acetobacteraceae bacterium]
MDSFERTVFAALLALGLCGPAHAQKADPPFRLGIMEDMSGAYRDLNGPGDMVAASLAVEDFDGHVLGKPIEVLSGDMQNSVDAGMTVARHWYDVDDVRVIFGLGNSAVALAVQQLGTAKGRINISTSAGSTDLTGKQCSALGVQWTYDTYSDAKVTGSAVVASGKKKWFFLTADYAFGHSLQDNTEPFIRDGGGTVTGSVAAPIGQSDYSTYLLQAQSSGADVVGIAAAGADMINIVKQMAEFGLINQGALPAGLVAYITDVHAIGLKTAQGLYFTEAFYWDQDDATRAFSARFAKRFGRPPTSLQASVYGAVMHYLKAVQAAGTDDAATVMARMKATPINDFMTHNGYIRADGRVIRDMYLLQAKRPEDSKGEWDLAKVVATVPGDQAFRPLKDGHCPLVP